MPAPKSNQFWRARTKHGRARIFASKDVLWKACQEYFEWVDDNPLFEARPFSYQGSSWVEDVPKMRAMTIGGLCIFLDIDETTWREWRKSEDFSPIVTRVERIIYEQKFTGAAADLLNPNIIARDLGLAEKQDHTSSDGSMSPPKSIDEFYR